MGTFVSATLSKADCKPLPTFDVGLGSAWGLEDGDDGGGDGVSATSGDGVGVEIALTPFCNRRSCSLPHSISS